MVSQFADGPLFTNRADAGAQLADRLADMPWSDPVVLGLARGCVPVAVRRAAGRPRR
jgi:putative phosphoribosyl transferase